MRTVITESLMDPKAFFILPDAKAGDAVVTVYVGGADGKATHHVSADAFLKALADAEFWRQRAKENHDFLMNEKAKVRRLMNALADEVAK